MNEQGIAWMIAGGVRAESPEDQRQVLHRIALAESRPSISGSLRRRIASIAGSRAEQAAAGGTLSADCCPA